MSHFLYGLLSDKLDEIAALYKVRPRITLIVRMPGKPDECAFLSDDAWPDAVATVERLYGDPMAFKAGPAEPKPDAPAPQPAPLPEAARQALAVLTEIADSAAYWSDYDVPLGIVSRVDEAKARLAAALASRGAKGGE